MLKTMLALSLTLSALTAHANDTAIPKIDVRKIEGSMKTGENVVFSGLNAKLFFEMLPPVAVSVPAEGKKLAKEYRHTLVIDQSGKRAVSLECTKVKYAEDGSKKAIPTQCTISLQAFGVNPDEDPMTYDFTPACTFH